MARKQTTETTPESQAEPGGLEQTNNEAPKPRTVIAVPLDDTAKRKHQEGEVARYFDDGTLKGVSARIDSPDQDFRLSEHVTGPLKEDHERRNKMRWKDRPEFQGKKRWHKNVRDNPVAERLDAEGRFEEMAKRRKDEIEGQNRE
jgi:hypothetical protein